MSRVDLAHLDIRRAAEQPGNCELVHPVNEEPLLGADGKPWTITVYSADSDVYRKAQRAIVDRRLTEAKSKGGKFKLNATMVDEEAVEALVAATTGWSGLEENEKPVEFSPKAARDLYTRFQWIRDQVTAFINDRRNFAGNL